jgi:hypothetical protein
VARYRRIFDAAKDSPDALYPYRAVLGALLRSPYFLYRTEVGQPSEAGRTLFNLTGFEVASFLSYSILGGPPSAELMERAARSELARPEVMKTVVREMLASGDARKRVQGFVGDWLDVDNIGETVKDVKAFPGFEKARPAMQVELQAFLTAFASVDGSYAGLLDGKVPRIKELDAYYASATASTASVRQGILGLSAFLATHAGPDYSSPTLRGHWIRERLLCDVLGTPPELPPLAVPSKGDPKTTRERYEQQMSPATCAPCHSQMDPLGFTLESFDAGGRFRLREDGVLVNTRAQIVGVDKGIDVDVSGYQQLNAAIAQSGKAQSCFARSAYRFLYGRSNDDLVEPLLQTSASSFRGSKRIGDLFEGLLTQTGFFTRRRD